MIDGSKERKCQLASELQNLRVFEKRRLKEEVTQSKNATEDQNRICVGVYNSVKLATNM